MSGAALVLTMVEAGTETSHLVPVEVAPRHRQSGVYPALCGAEVRTASLTVSPSRRCAQCAELAKPPAPTPTRRSLTPLQRRRGR